MLKAIYEERGYRSRDIPKLILENNLFGLDIDDRAAQLAGFALLMKAREDDRRIFSRGIRLNVMVLQGTQHLDASALWRATSISPATSIRGNPRASSRASRNSSPATTTPTRPSSI